MAPKPHSNPPDELSDDELSDDELPEDELDSSVVLVSAMTCDVVPPDDDVVSPIIAVVPDEEPDELEVDGGSFAVVVLGCSSEVLELDPTSRFRGVGGTAHPYPSIKPPTHNPRAPRIIALPLCTPEGSVSISAVFGP